MPDPEGANISIPLQTFDMVPSPGPPTSTVQTPGVQEPHLAGIAPQAQPERIVFGLRQDANHHRPLQNVVFNDDYDKRFPEDPYCQETAPNARIWRVYNEEAAAYDAVFVGQARDGLDVMLVFAGLFSAVVTSFLVQVSQRLQADYNSMSAILLYDLVSIQLSIADGSSSRLNITAPSINPLQPFRPASLTVWINGLWVVSLTMSLVVALSAVLVKQWLHHYTSIPSGTPGERSHLRQYRFDGLEKWRVKVIIGLFPIIMHVSLALFLVGLMLFFIPVRTSLACVVGAITAILCLLYLISNALPIFFPQCPYQTPLTDFLHHTCLALKNASRSISGYVQRFVASCKTWIHRCFSPGVQPKSFQGFDMREALSVTPGPSKGSSTKPRTLEIMTVNSNYDELSVDALDWLLDVSSNPTVHSLLVQAIGGLPPDVQAYARATWGGRDDIRDVRQRLFSSLSNSLHRDNGYYNNWERLTRSRYFFSDGDWYWNLRQVQKTRFDDPHVTATAWAAIGEQSFPFGRDWPDPFRDLRKFFCTFSQEKLHPFVWEGLIRVALRADSHFFQVPCLEDLSDPDYARIVSLFFPASQPRAECEDVSIWLSGPRHSITRTLTDVLYYCMKDISESVESCLLKMLSSHTDDLPPTLPPRHRLLYKAARFALCYLQVQADGSYTIFGYDLEVLMHVLTVLDREYDTIFLEHPDFLGPMLELLNTIIDDTAICVYPKSLHSRQCHVLLDDALSLLMRLLIKSKVFSSPSRQPESVSPSIHRLLQVPAYYVSEGPDTGPFTVRDAFELMQTAMDSGNEAMYQAFIDGGWMWMLAERWIVALNITDTHCDFCHHPILAFIRGLQSSGSALALRVSDYLQQTRNFIIAFIAIALNFRFDEADRVKSLLWLCPKDSSLWVTHRATMDCIIDWCRAFNGTDLPPPFDNLFNGKVLQTSEGGVSLDEALRKVLALDSYRKNVECAARTIILGEAAQTEAYSIMKYSPQVSHESLKRTA